MMQDIISISTKLLTATHDLVKTRITKLVSTEKSLTI